MLQIIVSILWIILVIVLTAEKKAPLYRSLSGTSRNLRKLLRQLNRIVFFICCSSAQCLQLRRFLLLLASQDILHG